MDDARSLGGEPDRPLEGPVRRTRRVAGRPARRGGRRVVGAIALSVLVHGLLGAALLWRYQRPVEDEIVELQIIDLGDAEEEVAPELPPSETVAPQPTPAPAPAPQPPPTPTPKQTAVAPAQPLPVVEAPGPADTPPQSPVEATPRSFRDWQQARPVPYAKLDRAAVAAGPSGGSRKGVDRCEPPAGRRAEVVYLLFDSSGSMTQTSGPNAITCAHQYAKAAIAGGAAVVIGNFARGATFHGPTRSMLDVEIALRAPSDNTATVLPVRELQPYVDAAPDAVADLVIVSDGIFADDGTIYPWYGYFLGLNADNRGRMFTVGGLGARESVAALRRVGFDVVMYDPFTGSSPARR